MTSEAFDYEVNDYGSVRLRSGTQILRSNYGEKRGRPASDWWNAHASIFNFFRN